MIFHTSFTYQQKGVGVGEEKGESWGREGKERAEGERVGEGEIKEENKISKISLQP